MLRGCLFLFAFFPIFGQTIHSIRLQGLDFDVSGFDQIPRGAYQLIGQGENFLVRHRKDPFVSLIDPSGRLLKVIGKKGMGPGEFSSGVLAMATYKNYLAVVDTNRTLMLHLFKDYQFKKTIRLQSEHVRPYGHAAQDFAISEKAIVYPAHRNTGHLAYAYGFDESITPVGSTLFGEGDTELLEKVPDVNDTLWYFQEPFFYCVFKHYPIVLVFDHQFRQQKSISIDSRLLEETRLARLDYNSENFVSAKPIIYDAQILGKTIFFASGDYIWRASLETGTVEEMYRFYVDDRETRRYVRWFHVLDGKFYIGDVINESDLWIAKIPKDSHSQIGG